MSKKMLGSKAGYPVILFGLAVMPFLSGCSASFLPAGPNLVGVGDFQDESQREDGDVLFQKKKLEKLGLPAPDITGSLQCTKASNSTRFGKYRVTIHKNMDCLLK